MHKPVEVFAVVVSGLVKVGAVEASSVVVAGLVTFVAVEA